MIERWIVGLSAVLTLSVVLVAVTDDPEATVAVQPGDDVAAMAAADPGAVLVLAPGRHRSFTLEHPATVRAAPGAEIDGPVLVRADGVRLEGLVVRGGADGISVRDVTGAVLSDVSVIGADVHGIEVVDAEAVIDGCHVRGLRHPYSQGVEVRNTTGRAPVVVRGCDVSGSREGIVVHSAHVVLAGNVVTATTNRALAVTEMSEGLVAGNRVSGVTGAAFMCEDMSRCDFVDNEVSGVVAGPDGVRSRSGQALVALYHSMAHWGDNRVDGAAAPEALVGSAVMDRSALSRLRGAQSGLLARVR